MSVVHREARVAAGAARGGDHLTLAAGLRSTEPVDDDRRRQQPDERVLHGRREDRAAREDRSQGREVPGSGGRGRAARGLERVHERTGEGVAHDHEERHPFVRDELEQTGRVEVAVGRDDDCGAGEERPERHPVRGAVHERARGERAAAALQRGVDDELGTFDARSAGISAHQRAEEDVLVAPQHAFRHARRSAGVEDVEVVGRAGAEVAVGGCLASAAS